MPVREELLTSRAAVALLAALFVLSLGAAGLVALALVEGAELSRAELKGAGFVLALPMGTGWLLWAVWRRRREIASNPRGSHGRPTDL